MASLEIQWQSHKKPPRQPCLSHCHYAALTVIFSSNMQIREMMYNDAFPALREFFVHKLQFRNHLRGLGSLVACWSSRHKKTGHEKGLTHFWKAFGSTTKLVIKTNKKTWLWLRSCRPSFFLSMLCHCTMLTEKYCHLPYWGQQHKYANLIACNILPQYIYDLLKIAPCCSITEGTDTSQGTRQMYSESQPSTMNVTMRAVKSIN